MGIVVAAGIVFTWWIILGVRRRLSTMATPDAICSRSSSILVVKIV